MLSSGIDGPSGAIRSAVPVRLSSLWIDHGHSAELADGVVQLRVLEVSDAEVWKGGEDIEQIKWFEALDQHRSPILSTPSTSVAPSGSNQVHGGTSESGPTRVCAVGLHCVSDAFSRYLRLFSRRLSPSGIDDSMTALADLPCQPCRTSLAAD